MSARAVDVQGNPDAKQGSVNDDRAALAKEAFADDAVAYGFGPAHDKEHLLVEAVELS